MWLCFLVFLLYPNSSLFLYASDSDLHMTALALELCCTLMSDKRARANVGLAVRNKVLPQALTLIKSPLLQGQALMVLFKLYGVCFLIQNVFVFRNFFIEYCRLCKAFLLHWSILQTQVLKLYWTLSFQVLSHLPSLAVLQNRLCVQ